MYFIANLQKVMPQIVYPIEVTLAFIDSYLQRIVKSSGKVGTYDELAACIRTLEEFHKSVTELKYGLFEQGNQDAESAVEAAREAVRRYDEPPEAVNHMIAGVAKADAKITAYIKTGFDPRIARIETYLKLAKSLQKTMPK